MREILFRGKGMDGEWYEGSLSKETHEKPSRTSVCYIIRDIIFGYASDYEFDNSYMSGCESAVIPETIGQYTGLTDKNGTKIFEGDIVLFEDECPTNYEYHDSTEMRCGEMRFDDGEFYLTNRIAVEMGDLVYNGKLDGEIIGNIHDNPELLKGE